MTMFGFGANRKLDKVQLTQLNGIQLRRQIRKKNKSSKIQTMFKHLTNIDMKDDGKTLKFYFSFTLQQKFNNS